MLDVLCGARPGTYMCARADDRFDFRLISVKETQSPSTLSSFFVRDGETTRKRKQKRKKEQRHRVVLKIEARSTEIVSRRQFRPLRAPVHSIKKRIKDTCLIYIA